MPSPILVLQHVAPETPGLIGDALTAQGIETQTVKIYAGEPVPQHVGEASALLIMGGPMGAYEENKYPHLTNELRLIETAVAEGVPVLGVCLGSQLLAKALGATVQPGSKSEIGWQTLTLTDAAQGDPLFRAAPRTFVPWHWHTDVFNLPDGAIALASSEMTPLQAYRYDGGAAPAYGLLFHMEATLDIVTGMTELFDDEARAVDLEPEALRAAAPERLTALRPVARAVFARWARLVAEKEPYLPIDCGFHDQLEALAVRGTVVSVEIEDGGAFRARIADVFARGGADYARLAPEDGQPPQEVRLDRVLAVSGIPRPDAC